MKGQKGRDISVPKPSRKAQLVINKAASRKMDDVARGVEDMADRRVSASFIVHHLIMSADKRKLIEELAK